jgi:DNA repair exonuclease SbcCD ATPase subunit
LDVEIAKHDEASRARIRRDLIAVIRKAYPHWSNYTELEAKVRPLRAEIASTEAALTHAKEMQLKLAETHTVSQQIAVYKTYLTNRLLIIETMAQKFKLYSDWLYPNRVKPLLENAVNSVLKSIPLPRPIRFVAEWEAGHASWYVQDGASRPPFEKASGAQRFFVSLALRLAFSRMGTSNMVNGQIFLDEGFTACDAETMEHIPSLLRTMLQQMEHLQTIFIVSHLDTLKSAATTQIRIHRGAQNSSLMVGERVQTAKLQKQRTSEDVPAKRRGRPPKAIEVANEPVE